jgi:hypothetical protein
MFCFIVPTCLKSISHINQLFRCITSIKKHYDVNIYIINDSDSEYDYFFDFLSKNVEKIHVYKTLINGSADQQVFKFILDKNYTETHFIIFQDSMILNDKFENIENVKNVKFLWHFTNHIIHWDNIKEPETNFNKLNNIITHTDLIKYHLINFYNENSNFIEYSLYALKYKNTWCGCFGNCCIITKKCVEYINNKTNFANKFVNNTSNRERRMNESIFSLLCHFYFPNHYENSIDGLYYDGINDPNGRGKKTGFDNLEYCCINKIVSKISFNR